ncbi:MAG: SDR family oxidoreductase [Archangium sp.]|nr:SDR family oxidoreductase [Archangium sp.]MDP3152720.1 SDR family oxidoreductase [Archangium sp.]MDP3573507.1 SDR family oxidoreductase [Archangium sp.]
MSERLGAKTTAQQALQGQSLFGKQAIVTGASSGLGIETTRVLALAGADVVMAVRNMKAGEEVATTLRASLPAGSGKLEVKPLDLTDLASVRRFSDEWIASGRALHLLINNAGVMATPEGKTVQGFELQLGTNHLGHFALTTGLLPALERSAPARIVVVSSGLHTRGKGERLLATLEGKPVPYTPYGAYGDSKLANVLFAKALAKRLPAGVEVFSLHPGVIPTPLSRSMGAMGAVFRTVGKLFMKTVEQGAATSIFAATAPQLAGQSGAYLADCRVAQPTKEALDPSLIDKVWAQSEKAIRA